MSANRHSLARNLSSATELPCDQAMCREAGMSKSQKRSATRANRSPGRRPEARLLPDRRGSQDQARGAESCRRFRLAHSELAARIRAFDWASTDTGLVSEWTDDVQPLSLFAWKSHRRSRQNSQPPWKSTRGARPNLGDRYVGWVSRRAGSSRLDGVTHRYPPALLLRLTVGYAVQSRLLPADFGRLTHPTQRSCSTSSKRALADRTKLFDGRYRQDLTTKGKIFKARSERAD